MNKFLSEAGPP